MRFFPALIAIVVVASLADAALISNGDLELAVSQHSDTDGASIWSLDAANNVTRNGGDSGIDADAWVWTRLSNGWAYSGTGGNGGGGGFVQNSSSNERPRAVGFFADDAKATAGDVDVSIDFNFGHTDQSLHLELYAWNNGQTAPGFSWGGPTANNPPYNVTVLGDADTLLDTQISASNLGSWQTISLGSVALGSGYDHYAWRVGILGADNGTSFAFDNLTVAVPEPSTFALAFLGLLGMVGLRRRKR
jgi:hypothetical protein